MSVCTVDGCERAAVARGLCRMHYSRARRGAPAREERPEVGSVSGVGRYGVLEESDGLVMCHECGQWLRSVGSHLHGAHEGMTAREYRERHGLPRGLGLVAADVREGMSEHAREQVGTVGWSRFEAARDPVAASAARDGESLRSARVVAQGRAARAGERGRASGVRRERSCSVCGRSWVTVPGDQQSRRRAACSPECVAVLAARGAARARENAAPGLAARDAQIVELAAQGLTRREIAERVGLTSVRVGQILRRRPRA